MASRRLKKSGSHLLRILFALAVLVGALLWLLGTEPALRWAARQAERLSEGRLTLSDVQGSLYGTLKIGAASFQTEGQRFELKQASLEWAPLSLLGRDLRVERLSLQELRIIVGKPAAEPARLPETLALPFTFSLPTVTVGRVVLDAGGRADVFSDIDLGIEKRADSYALTLRSMTSAWASARADMVLGDTRPFPLSAHATLRQSEGLPYRLAVTASGNLAQLLLSAKAHGLGGQATLAARLAPFEQNPLLEARIKADKLDPALFAKGLPHADFSADVAVAGQGKGRLEGSLLVRNDLPGTWDGARLPLSQMAASFAGTLEHLDLRAIRLDFAGAGQFRGEGQVDGGKLQLRLSTAGFDPRGVQGSLRSLSLAGELRLQADAGSQQLTADLRDRSFRLHVDARHRDGVVELHQASLQSGAGKLEIHGTLDLDRFQRFRLAGALQGFDPAALGDYPAARVNASFTGTGQLAAQAQATLNFAIADSQFRHQALSGQGRLSASATRLWDSDLNLRLAGNRLALNGALGRAGDRLAIRIEADQLALLAPELAGRAHATATLEGSLSAPSGKFETQISNLSWRKVYRIAKLQASGRLDRGLDGPLALDLSLQGLASPPLHLERASVTAQGSRSRHSLQIRASSADVDLAGRLDGGWRDDSGWSGRIASLTNRGRHPLVLNAPAGLELGRDHFSLTGARLDFLGAHLVLDEMAYDAGRISSRGRFQGFPVAYLQGLTDEAGGIATDLTAAGEWQFSAGARVDGHVALWREGGDLSLSGAPLAHLGLSRLAMDVTAVNNRLRAKVEAVGSHLGRLEADGQAMLSRRDDRWGIAGDSPVQASIDLSVNSLAWIAPLIDKSGALVFDGAVSAKLAADGTFAQPGWAGRVSGERLSVALADQGVNFKEGRFEAELRDQALQLKSLSLLGGDGNLKGQGRLSLDRGSPAVQVALTADKLEVLSRPDRRLVLSGTGTVSLQGAKLQLAAKLKADRGEIELSEADAPTQSSDVVVLGRLDTAGKRRSPYALGFDLDLDLGEHFFLKGKGLDARLGGALKLTSVDGALPSSRGSISVREGTYSAYGQRLAIERGILNFQGPVDNPGLNIIAMRKDQPVEAGVAVTGTAQSPQVKLVSKPDVPDSSKLSWLVLGHGLDDASGQEFSALQAAAGALLATGQSVSLQQRIAHAAGLEEVSLKGGSGLEGTVLALGKRLSSRAYLSYEQGLAGAVSLVKINYTLSKHLSVRAQAGTTPAVDLFYTFSFD